MIMLTLNEAAVIEGLFSDYEHVRDHNKTAINEIALHCDPLAILVAQNIDFDADYTLEETPRETNKPGQKVYNASI